MHRLDGIERLPGNRTTLEMVNCMRATNNSLKPVGEQLTPLALGLHS